VNPWADDPTPKTQLALDGGETALDALRPLDDFYKTPQALIGRVLLKLTDVMHPQMHWSILDAGTGDGVLLKEFQRWQSVGLDHLSLHALEIDVCRTETYPERWGVFPGVDFFKYDPAEKYDLVITNGPFARPTYDKDGQLRVNDKGQPILEEIWTDWVLHCLKLGRNVLAMGFANVLDGDKRVKRLLKPHPPTRRIHCGRWKFNGAAGNAPRDVVWLYWKEGEPGQDDWL